jgi:phage terminase small subunit
MIDETPEADPQWLAEIRYDWEAFWVSAVARHMDPIHVPALKRLFTYRSQWLELKHEVEKADTNLVKGSTGNMVLNPLIRAMRDTETQINVLETQFGMTLKSATQLGIELGTAALTWQQVAKGGELPTGGAPPPLELPVTVVE